MPFQTTLGKGVLVFDSGHARLYRAFIFFRYLVLSLDFAMAKEL